MAEPEPAQAAQEASLGQPALGRPYGRGSSLSAGLAPGFLVGEADSPRQQMALRGPPKAPVHSRFRLKMIKIIQKVPHWSNHEAM